MKSELMRAKESGESCSIKNKELMTEIKNKWIQLTPSEKSAYMLPKKEEVHFGDSIPRESDGKLDFHAAKKTIDLAVKSVI